MKLAEHIKNIALSYVGNVALNKNEGFFNKSFENKMSNVGWVSGWDWCAFFVKLVWKEAIEQSNPENSKSLSIKVNRLTGSSNDNWRVARNQGLKLSALPVIGAIAVFTNAENGEMLTTGHTGIVVGFDSLGLTVVEGNTTFSGNSRGDRRVAKRRRLYSTYGSPYMDFTSVASTGKGRYLRGFIYPPDVEVGESLEPVNVTEKQALSFDSSIKDVLYTFSRDAGLVADKSGIGDASGLVIQFDRNFSYEDFLNYKGRGSNYTNRTLIRNQKIIIDGDNQTSIDDQNDDQNDNFIKSGTIVSLPFKYIVRDDTGLDRNATNSTDYNITPYYTDTLTKMLKSTGYRPIGRSRLGGGRVHKVSDIVSVWIYFKSINKILNVTKFVNNLNINSTKQMSNFTFQLKHVDDISFHSNFNRVFHSSFNENISYFHRYLSVNDLVFIKLEELELEESRNSDFVISENDLDNQYYDLIGLIDTFPEIRNSQDADMEVEVSGRDFSKVFQDDEAVFFPLVLVPNANGQMVVGTAQTGSSLFKRTYTTGNYDYIFAKTYQSVGWIFAHYLSILSNIGCLPESVNDTFFSSYVNEDGSDRREYRAGTKELEKELQRGVYQIIKLNVDPNVEHIKVIDSNVGNPEGPFSNLFNRICQEPFVEYLTDTYNDTFNIVVRRPPYNKISLTKTIEEKLYLDLDETIISSTQLAFSQEIYTWFQLQVKGLFFGASNQVALAYCPIIQLDEYVNLWGSRRLAIVHNYRTLIPEDDSKTLGNYNEFRKAAVDDLVYLVETHSYLPFTRTGTIRLSMTDRRIKKGTYVRLPTTNELFYVESVQHTVIADTNNPLSFTTLTVSRGMVKDFIVGLKGEDGVEISYFNIVNLDLLKKVLYKQYFAYKTPNNENISGTIVNKQVFQFFLERDQFSVAPSI